MCPEEDYSTVVETLGIDDNWREKFGLELKKPKNHEYQPTENPWKITEMNLKAHKLLWMTEENYM